MKKNFFKLIIALVFVMIPCLLAFSACSLNVESAVVSYNLNGGSFTEEFKTEKGITSNNFSTMVNLNYYDGFLKGLPDESDLKAPTGKVFAGWYIDKLCTAENYLTSQTWEVLVNNIRGKKGSAVYAKWIDAGKKEIIIELSESFSFNSTTSKTICLSYTSDQFAEIPNDLQNKIEDVSAVGKQEFTNWKVECNGHYYDFVKHEDAEKSTTTVNSGCFDSEKIKAFLEDGRVSYVLLRPGNLTDKPNQIITLNMSGSGVYIKLDYAGNGRIVGLAENSNCLFGTDGIGTTAQDENGKTVYSGLSLSVIYDIKYSDLNTILPNADYLTGDVTGKKWQFTVNESTYDFNEENWDREIKKLGRPTEETKLNITFTLVNK